MTASTKEFWEKVYQDNIGKLIGVSYRYTRNYHLSEDLAHDAFLKAIDKAGTFEGKGKFEAWLRRIVVNHVLQYLRDRKKGPYINDLIPAPEPPDITEENIHSTQSMSFTSEELIETIEQLPEHHRLVFNLYVMDEFTHAQIGSVLGISEGTSKSHLARARKKLKQLLTQKAEKKRNEKEHKKAPILLVGGNADEYIDQVFREGFDNFSIPPQHPLSLESISFNSSNKPGSNSFVKWNATTLVTSAIVVLSLVIILAARHIKKPEQKATLMEKNDSTTLQKNTSIFSSPTATVSQDRVILKTNVKQKEMKPLDSLALMLVLASSPFNDDTAKDSIRHEIEKYSQVDVKFPADAATGKSILNVVDSTNTNKKESGTFRATELYWSEENKEVYFKGKVRVNFKEQHFQGKGSFTFLGKINLLIVNGQQVALGNTLKLADTNYELVTLDSKEATEKYGDKGRDGAVEISRTE